MEASKAGMKQYRNLILIVIILAAAIWIALPNNPGIKIGFLEIDRQIKTHLGLDLVGGVQVLLEANPPAGTDVTTEAMNTARKIVENRVNGMGVSEASVQAVGSRRILVELPGIDDPQQAIETVKGTGLLEFIDMSSITQDQAILLIDLPVKTTYNQAIMTDTTVLTQTIQLQDTVWTTAMTGEIIQTAYATADQLGNYQVDITFTSEGGTKFAEYTASHVGTVLGIVLDGVLISAPSISQAIDQGQAYISGSFDYDSANQLAVQLRYGALPIPLIVVETRAIGPSLGQDSLQKSLVAGGVGAVIVLLFMLLYYRLPGTVAALALLIYGVITFALYKFIPVTLTLPGIAGFLLSTGSALDANILIFERMKEELRNGRTLNQAIYQGWQRAWPSIRDSNIATLLICAILAYFGSQSGATIVIGFAFTLAVGVLVSLFTALLVTRTLLDLVLNFFKPTNMGRWFGI